MAIKRILFLGGTRFFGKLLVQNLIKSNKYQISIMTRGNELPQEFTNKINFISCDRSDSYALESALKNKVFDIAVDNIAYKGANDVRTILDILQNKIEHYLLCSSGAVYPSFGLQEWREEEATLQIRDNQPTYANNKREAEQQLLSYKNIPFTIYRPTVVQGPNDFTQRTRYFIEKIYKQETFYIPETVILKHIYSIDLANAIEKLITLDPENKAYNLCGDDKFSLEEYCRKIAKFLQKKSTHILIPDNEFVKIKPKDFPNSYDRSLLLSNELVKSKINYRLTAIDDWLPNTIQWHLNLIG